MKISLLTGGDSPHYMFPLAAALVSRGIEVDFIGSDYMATFPAARTSGVNFLNLRGDQSEDAPARKKILRILRYYARLLAHAARTDSPILHVQWMNKFVHFDRTLLNVFYKLVGKKLVFTAHNVNDGERDQTDSLLNRLTLRFLYRIVDRIIVHTQLMKQQLVQHYGVDGRRVSVIPIGVFAVAPRTPLTKAEARGRLGLAGRDKVLLCFGLIASYKGLDVLVEALREVAVREEDVKLVIAGKIKAGNDAYWRAVQERIRELGLEARVLRRIEFIPEDDVETYFKAADVVVLPYRNIFQTGVMFLAYNYGLPALVSDVGSLREYVLTGEESLVCRPEDPADLANKICDYFRSGLYRQLELRREEIRETASREYSWDTIAIRTEGVYRSILPTRRTLARASR